MLDPDPDPLDRFQNVANLFPCWDHVISPSFLKRTVILREMLRNLLKFPVIQCFNERSEKVESDPEIVSGTGALPKVNRFFPLVGPICNYNTKFQRNRP